MDAVPEPLQAFCAYSQFILWTTRERDGKTVKLPIDYRTGHVANAHDPAIWLSADHVFAVAAGNYGVGFVFTEDDPFFFLDIDNCWTDAERWSPLALEVLGMLPGAAVEISQSGRGLHVFGAYTSVPEHTSKNIALGLELYTSGRFVALTGTQAAGSAALDCTDALAAVIQKYFPPSGGAAVGIDQEWTDKPVTAWAGIEDNDALIEKARNSESSAAVFAGAATFRKLWEADEDALGVSYPDQNRAYDASSADLALAQHLAFWTGNNCTRMWDLMWRSELKREKWNREDYLVRTILRATSRQESFHNVGRVNNEIADAYGGSKLKANSDKQRNFATNVRAEKLAACNGDEVLIRQLCSTGGPNMTAKFWLDNRDKTPQELAAMITPLEVAPVAAVTGQPKDKSGYQFLSADLQKEYFAGCCYIQDRNGILIPSGAVLGRDQFNATYGGFVFQMDESRDTTTKKAWEAFTESQVVQFPKVESGAFRPELGRGEIILEEGRHLVNVYVPILTERKDGDPTPVLDHLAKLLHDSHDRQIILAYMAACVQYKGIKFQWAPLIQGVEGNGKTLLTRCVVAAIGERYTHMPPASEIGERFNAWLFDKLFIGIEDVNVPEHKREVIEILKPMITNDRLAMRAMQRSQVMGDNRANFMLNTNNRNALHTTKNDRRFSVFFTAQQEIEHLRRDGMDGKYFPRLYDWLRAEGYAIFAKYLENYTIPDELNPATECHRAPWTSTTDEAIKASLGGIEQEIAEAIDEGRPGFAGGWISSIAVERLLISKRADRIIPPGKRRELLRTFGYDWHPALKDGRVNSLIVMDNGKPRLYIKAGHPAESIETPAQVVKEYMRAQDAAARGVSAAEQDVVEFPQK